MTEMKQLDANQFRQLLANQEDVLANFVFSHFELEEKDKHFASDIAKIILEALYQERQKEVANQYQNSINSVIYDSENLKAKINKIDFGNLHSYLFGQSNPYSFSPDEVPKRLDVFLESLMLLNLEIINMTHLCAPFDDVKLKSRQHVYKIHLLLYVLDSIVKTIPSDYGLCRANAKATTVLLDDIAKTPGFVNLNISTINKDGSQIRKIGKKVTDGLSGKSKTSFDYSFNFGNHILISKADNLQGLTISFTSFYNAPDWLNGKIAHALKIKI
jgi:hypothetical protein